MGTCATLLATHVRVWAAGPDGELPTSYALLVTLNNDSQQHLSACMLLSLLALTHPYSRPATAPSSAAPRF